MTEKYIDIADNWGVVVCYDLKRLDEYEMRQNMIVFGMRGSRLDEAVEVLLDRENTGMCISRSDIRMSLVFIGNATGTEQFWDTCIHEMYHVACAIGDYYNVPYDSEDFAWLMGYLMRKLVLLIGEPCV